MFACSYRKSRELLLYLYESKVKTLFGLRNVTMAGFDQLALIVDEWNRRSLTINEVVVGILDEWDISTMK